MKRLTRVFAETTHGTKGYESVNEIRVNTESIHNLSEVVTTLGTLEDILEKYGIENLEEYISALIEVRNIAIEEKKTQFKRYIEEVTKREKIEQELAELKQKAIVPKFERQSHIYGFAYGKIKHYVVIAYLDNTITLCEDTQSNTFEFCNNDYLVATKEEAEQKLAEIKGE